MKARPSLISQITEKITELAEPVKAFLLYGALVTFMLSLLLFFLGRLLPDIPIPQRFVPDSLLQTITPPLSIILIYELLLLTLATTGSFVTFVVRQFEIVSLIIVRDLFKRLDALSAGFETHLLIEIAVVAFGGVLLYFMIEVLERIEAHFTLGDLKEELPAGNTHKQRQFKNFIELGLMMYFLTLVAIEGVGFIIGIPGMGYNDSFIRLVFSGLIVFSIFLLLLVMIVQRSYEVLFEHTALVLAAVVVLIALEGEMIIAIPMIISALLFVILTLLLHGFARGKSIRQMTNIFEKSS